MQLQYFFQSLWGIINEMSPYILLGFLIAGFLHVFIKPAAMSRHLAGSGIMPVVKAALFGIPLPLCSCGVLPTAVALRRQGASKGATTSFLIATPQTGVDSIAATYSLLGLPFAILRPIAALIGSVIGGGAVNKLAQDEDSIPDTMPASCCASTRKDEYAGLSLPRKIVEAVRYGLVDMVASVGKWLVIGLVIASLITVLVPDQLFLTLNRYPLLAMGVMILVAVPMYVCATGSIPIAMSLMLKGLSPGVAFVLLMAGPAANFASVMVLSRTMGRRATLIYVGSVVATAIGFGLMIDYLLPSGWFIPQTSHLMSCHDGHSETPLFPTVCSILLGLLLIYTAIKSHSHNNTHTHNPNKNTMRREYIIEGMSCPHCQATVTKAISALSGAENVTTDLSTGTAIVEGEVSPEAVKEAVYNAGFTIR